MSRQFCPDYGALPTLQGYRPMHSWFADEKLRLTTYKDGPRYFPTFSQARNAAKEYVAMKINGRDRSEQTAVADVLGVAEWKRDRAGRAASDQIEAFGTIFVKHKPVIVEKRRGR